MFRGHVFYPLAGTTVVYSLKPAQVLAVDEDVTFLLILSDILQTQHPEIRISRCTSAIEALALMEVNHYDVVITHAVLPDLAGVDFLEAIERQHPGLPVLVTANYGNYPDAMRLMQQGAYDLITKPVDWEYVMASLQSAIRMQQVRRLEMAGDTSSLEGSTLLQGLKVLIVDDDPGSQDMQKAALVSYGAQVVVATSVQAALDVIEWFSPQIIVSDIRMPYEDGYSLVRKLRRKPTEARQTTPAIAITAYAHEEERKQALLAGFQVQLAKPIDPGTLTLTVANLVGRV